MTDKPLCIYHANCADGFGAAWVVWKYFEGAVDFHPGVYGKPPPDVTGRDVIIVDFSYKRPVLKEMAESAHTIVVLDHHKTAREDLISLHQPKHSWHAHSQAWDEIAYPYLTAKFDMRQSGARLTWGFFFPHHRCPELLLHIEDRDLWRFNMDRSKEIHAALMSHPMEFETWDYLMMNKVPLVTLKEEGAGILRANLRNIKNLIDTGLQRMNILSHDVPVLNCPPMWASDAGNILCVLYKDAPFAATYWDDGKVVKWSLRSSDEGVGMDVEPIARAFGGGGHRNACGFETPSRGQPVELISPRFLRDVPNEH